MWMCLRRFGADSSAGAGGYSANSGCFASQSGRTLRTVGSSSKLCSAGGESVVHSKVWASHGSLPASRPLRRLLKML